MHIKNGFVLNIPSYLQPAYRISPFQTKHIIQNKINNIDNNTSIDNYFNQRFIDKNFIYTKDGRSAIEQAILALNLNMSDTITIVTTTNNLYISSCVTEKIDKYCQWSRKIEKSTKAILVNHEFGYCVEDMKYYKSLGYPIIEDFAHSFSASNSFEDVGKYADFLIFSLSKFFPIQMGGVLVYIDKYINIKEQLLDTEKKYIQNNLSAYINDIDSINKTRISNYDLYKQLFTSIGVIPTLTLQKNNIPAVFMFDVDEKIDLNQMKKYINNHGIESSVFYGRKSYFVPNHQNLNNNDIEYIFTVVKSFLEKYSK